MLDENLPTYYFRSSPDKPLSTVLYFTHNGSEPEAYYSLQKKDPTLPEAKNKYSITLHDASWQDIIFAGVTIEPNFTQPTLSAAEIRAQNGVPPAPVPLTPEKFIIEMNQPPQDIAVTEKRTWTGKETFEFDIPQSSFQEPSTSKIDRGQQRRDADAHSTPTITFRWKRESKFSKDMTCYMTGSSVGGNKSKEPDITVALYKHGKDQAVTIYDPNLQRVPVQDKRGLEVVFLLSAAVIRDVYLSPGPDTYNVNPSILNKRKNSKPVTGTPASTRPEPYTMTGVGQALPGTKTNSPLAQQSVAQQDPEVKRLQAITQQEEKEREKRDKAEQKRIKKMLEEEEKERKRRDAEVAKETERLRKEFGMEGQDYRPPTLPPRVAPNSHNQASSSRPTLHVQTSAYPPRPFSTEPPQNKPGRVGWFDGPGMASTLSFFGSSQAQNQNQPGRRRGNSGDGKIRKKKSTFF